MSAPLSKAMILAAGLGTRMMPLTQDRPKPLVELAGRTLIDRVIDKLKAGGVTHFLVNVHYKADLLSAHLKTRKDVDIRICDETKEILDTGGAIAQALPFFEGQAFFVQNSDSLWVEGMGRSVTRMRSRWNEDEMDALMLLAPSVTAIGYEGNGDFRMAADGRLTRRTEMTLAPFVFTGLQIVHPRLFDGAPRGRFSINPLWDKAIDKNRLYGMRLDGTWIHVGTPQGLKDAENFLADLQHAP